MDREEALHKYVQQKENAIRRGIEWEFTFDEWCQVWEPHWDRRGPKKDQLGMCRTRDQGPYAASNVRLDTPKGNAADRSLMRRRTWTASAQGEEGGFRSYASRYPNPEIALEMERGEREFEPYK